MADGWEGFALAFGVGLLMSACSSDESGVLTADGSIVEVGAAGAAGSAAGGSAGTTSTDGAAVTDALVEALGALDSSGAGDGASAMCNAVMNSATMVTPTAGAGAAPVLAGGAIATGTYVETKVEQFGGDGGLPPAEQSTIVIAGGTLSEVVKVGTTETRYLSTYTAATNTISFVTTCDSTFKFTGAWSASYAATATSFVYAFDANGGRQVKTYTKK